ncbi:MAG: hypothetical protein WAU11_00735 [Ignavibacteriaceae bacterium]
MKYNLIIIFLFLSGCKPIQLVLPEEQNIKINLVYACRQVDTFQNKFFIAFIPDTLAVDVWFTKQEQEFILNKLDSINFFTFPDSLPKEESEIIYHPYCYPASLRIKTNAKDKTVLFYRGTTEKYNRQFQALVKLADNILEMALNKKEY